MPAGRSGCHNRGQGWFYLNEQAKRCTGGGPHGPRFFRGHSGPPGGLTKNQRAWPGHRAIVSRDSSKNGTLVCGGVLRHSPKRPHAKNPLPTGAVAALGSQGSLRGGTGPPGGLTPATVGAWGVTVGNGCGGRQVAAARFAPKPSFNWPLGRALGVGGGGCCPFFCWRGPSGGLTPPPTKNQPPCTRAHKQHRPLQKKPESPRPCGPV